MKKVFMEPELKVTKFEYEDIMEGGIGVGGGPSVPDYGEEPDWD